MSDKIKRGDIKCFVELDGNFFLILHDLEIFFQLLLDVDDTLIGNVIGVHNVGEFNE